MTIITVEVTPTHRYFARKRKDDIIRWIEDLGGRRLSNEEHKSYRARTCDDLASEAMKLVRALPDR